MTPKMTPKSTPKMTPNSTPKKTPRLHSKFYNMPKFYIFFSLQVKCQILICINSLKITYIPIILLLTV